MSYKLGTNNNFHYIFIYMYDLLNILISQILNDLKIIKDKAATVKRESLKTGNEQSSLMLLSLESKITDIVGEVLISGDPIVHAVGINLS